MATSSPDHDRAPALVGRIAVHAQRVQGLAAIMLAKISTEPTDRSMPAVMITNVMPTDRISSTDVSISVVLRVEQGREPRAAPAH